MSKENESPRLLSMLPEFEQARRWHIHGMGIPQEARATAKFIQALWRDVTILAGGPEADAMRSHEERLKRSEHKREALLELAKDLEHQASRI